MRKLPARLVATGAVLALALAACGGSSGSTPNAGGANGSTTPAKLPACPLDALKNASGPVSITMWHSMTRANLTELNQLAAKFNASQSQVKVKLVNQPSYTDTLTQFTAGLSTKNLPDIVMSEEIAQQQMIDTQAVLPAQSCISADNYDTSDFVKRTIDYFTVGGVQYAMPFNVSNPVLYYDKNAFRAAGLDPNKPPATLDELKADAQQIVDKHVEKYGLAFKTDSWFLEQWLAMANHTFVNNSNGRQKRATAVTFDDAEGLKIFTFLSNLVKSHLALSTGENDYNHYFAVGNRQAAMTIDTSAALGTISQILGHGEFSGVDLGVGPLPGPGGSGGVLVGGGALFIVKQSSPEKQAAAWEFLKFLDSAQSQASWSAATGYLPIRKSATTLEPLKTLWQQKPYYRISYDQLLKGTESDATAGPVIGDYGAKGVGVRGAVIDAFDSMFVQHVAPDKALASAAKAANAAMTAYNDRVG